MSGMPVDLKPLKEYVGRRVTVEYVWMGIPMEEKGILRRIKDYASIEITDGFEGSRIPFIGYGSAIRRIRGEKGEVLFENPRIPLDYDLRKDEDINLLRALSFGSEASGWKERIRSIFNDLKTKLLG